MEGRVTGITAPFFLLRLYQTITRPYALFPREMQESGTELAKMFEEAGSFNRGLAKPAKKPLATPK